MDALFKAMAGCDMYICPNDHVYFAINTMPMLISSKCQACGAPIGKECVGNKRLGKIDKNGKFIPDKHIYMDKIRNDQILEQIRKEQEEKEKEEDGKKEETDDISFGQHGLDHLDRSYQTIDDKAVKDILNKNAESLQETKALINELSDTFNGNDDDQDEKDIVPPEMSDFFESVKDDLGSIADAQSQLQSTMELFDEILKHKPTDYDSNPESKKLWDCIVQNTANTVKDIEMVQDMRDYYIADLVKVTETMNEVETEQDTEELIARIQLMSEAQEKYKAKIMETTQNALESLRVFMKENVDKQQVDKINIDITTYQTLNFKAEEKVNKLYIAKGEEMKSIQSNIMNETKQLNELKNKEDDIKEEMERIRTLKIGREDMKKISLDELLMGRYNLRTTCSCTPSRRCSEIHIDYIYRYRSWRVYYVSMELETLEVELNDRYESVSKQRSQIQQKLKDHRNELIKVENEFDEKIRGESENAEKYQNEFKQSMEKLHETITKTGVDKDKLGDFLNLTQTVIPTMMDDQRSMNKLTVKCSSSYSLFIKGITVQKKKYEIKQYLEDNNQYEQCLELYVLALSQQNIHFMHQIQCESVQEFETNILSVLERRFIYSSSNNSGIYGSFCLNKVEVPKKVKRIFGAICLKNEHWRQYCKTSDSAGTALRKKTKRFTGKLGGILTKFQRKTLIKKTDKLKQIKQANYLLVSFDAEKGEIKCLDDEYNEFLMKMNVNDEELRKQIVEIQNIGVERRENVYIAVTELICNKRIKQRTILKAFSKKDQKLEKINSLEHKLEAKDQEIAALQEKLAMLSQHKTPTPSQQTFAIKGWLTDIVHLPQYIDIFVNNGFDEKEMILDLTMDDLKELNITKLGHRKKILKAVHAFSDYTML